jgi:hypothetical protein
MVLFVIELSTRKVEIAGIAPEANGLWMSQIARNLTDAEAGILTEKRYLIHDRDPLFTAEFLRTVVLANPEVADKVRVASLPSIPLFAFLGSAGVGFLGFLSPAYGASA